MVESEQSTGPAEKSRQQKVNSLCGTLRQAAEQIGELVVPSGAARRHFRNARVQVLMGVRELIDQRISHLSREEAKGTRVTVE